jgi:AAA15 family ATPase/GTPase
MGLHSSGASRLISILLAITAAERGIVLIDELENGFYYKTLSKIWKAIHALASEFSCQVFASTHSDECLSAATQIVEEDPKSYALLNMDAGGGRSKVTVSDGEVFGSALSSGFDIR